MLWELLTGEVPFSGIEGFQVAWLVVENGEVSIVNVWVRISCWYGSIFRCRVLMSLQGLTTYMWHLPILKSCTIILRWQLHVLEPGTIKWHLYGLLLHKGSCSHIVVLPTNTGLPIVVRFQISELALQLKLNVLFSGHLTD